MKSAYRFTAIVKTVRIALDNKNKTPEQDELASPALSAQEWLRKSGEFNPYDSNGAYMLNGWQIEQHMIDFAGHHVRQAAPGQGERDVRQREVSEWCAAAFGVDHASSVPQRGIRMCEEAIEACQAAGGEREMVHKLVDYVFDRPAGELQQEIGGVGLTLLALAQSCGVSAEAAELKEIARVKSKPLEHFHQRNQAKNETGFQVGAELTAIRTALAKAAEPLEAILLAIDWELSPEVMTLVKEGVEAIRGALSGTALRAQGGPRCPECDSPDVCLNFATKYGECLKCGSGTSINWAKFFRAAQPSPLVGQTIHCEHCGKSLEQSRLVQEYRQLQAGAAQPLDVDSLRPDLERFLLTIGVDSVWATNVLNWLRSHLGTPPKPCEHLGFEDTGHGQKCLSCGEIFHSGRGGPRLVEEPHGATTGAEAGEKE